MPANASVQVVIGALFTGGSAFGKATASISKIGDVVRRLGGQAKQLDQLRTAEQRAGLNVTSLTDRLAKQRAALLAAEGRVVSLKEKIAAAGDPTGKLAARLDSAEQAVLRAKAAIPQLDTQLVKARTDLTEASQAAEKFAAANAHVGAAVARLEPMLKRYDALQGKIAANASRRNELLLQGAQIGAAIYGVKKLVEAAAEGEEARLHLQWTLAPPDRAKIGDIVSKTRKFALGSLATMPELLEIQAVLNKEGLSAEVSLAASETAHKVAAVTQQEGGEVAKAIGAIYTQAAQSFTGRGPEEKLKQIGDLVSAMHHQFEITDVGGLGAGFAAVLPQARAARIPIEQVAASMGFLTRAGIDAGGAGTMLRQTLIQLDKAADKLGFRVVRDAQGNTDLTATFQAMNVAVMNTYGSLDRGKDAINQAFGAKRAQAVMILSRHTQDLMNAQKRLVEESAGSVDREYKELEESAKGTLTKIKKAFDEFLKPIGRALLPGVKAVLIPLGKLAQFVGGFLERFPMLAKVIGTVVVGTLALAAASWGVSYAWNFLQGGMLRLEAGLVKLGIRTLASKLGLLEMAGAETASGVAAGTAAVGQGALATAEGSATVAANLETGAQSRLAVAEGEAAAAAGAEGAAQGAASIGILARLPVLGRLVGMLKGPLGVTAAAAAAGWAVWEFGNFLIDHGEKPADKAAESIDRLNKKMRETPGAVPGIIASRSHAPTMSSADKNRVIDFLSHKGGKAAGAAGAATSAAPAVGEAWKSYAWPSAATRFKMPAPGVKPTDAAVTAAWEKERAAVSAWGKATTVPKMALGGIVDRPTLAQIGEAGPEAVVPLGRSPWMRPGAGQIGALAAGLALFGVLSSAPQSARGAQSVKPEVSVLAGVQRAAAPVHAAAAEPGDTITINNHITINAAPGMDEAKLAQQVDSRIDRSVRNALSRRRAALHD